MLKNDRHRVILELCDTNGTVMVKDIQKRLGISDMTVRRDLDELENQNKLKRIHGGAQSIRYNENGTHIYVSGTLKELSHEEKKLLNIEEKEYIAKKAAAIIDNPDDTIFLGPGTTIELMTQYIQIDSLRIITNSLPVFNLLKHKNYDLYLIGGSYREKTGAFVGSIADETIEKIGISKAFVGVNGIQDDWVSTFNVEEGKFQQNALDKAHERYLVADSKKFNHRDFYNFYNLKNINSIFTDKNLTNKTKQEYEKHVKIIN